MRRLRKLSGGTHPIVPRTRTRRPLLEQVRQHKRQDAKLFFPCHPPALAADQNSANPALHYQCLVLLARAIVSMDPDGSLRLTPSDDLRILDGVLSEHSPHGVEAVPDQLQRVGDRRNQRFVKQKEQVMRLEAGIPSRTLPAPDQAPDRRPMLPTSPNLRLRSSPRSCASESACPSRTESRTGRPVAGPHH